MEVLGELVKAGFRQEVTCELSFLSIRSPGVSEGQGHSKYRKEMHRTWEERKLLYSGSIKAPDLNKT